MSDGVEWALHVAAVLAVVPPDKGMTAAKLAEYHGVPGAYLAKHLQALTRAGVFEAVPGRGGGYRLARPAQDITVLEVVEAVEGRTRAFECSEIRQRGPAAGRQVRLPQRVRHRSRHVRRRGRVPRRAAQGDDQRPPRFVPPLRDPPAAGARRQLDAKGVVRMKVLVAGATGVVGTRAVRELVAAGHEVTGLARTDEKAKLLDGLGAKPVTFDVFDAADVRAHAAGHDAIVNLLTHIPPLSKAPRKGAWKENDRLRTSKRRRIWRGRRRRTHGAGEHHVPLPRRRRHLDHRRVAV